MVQAREVHTGGGAVRAMLREYLAPAEDYIRGVSDADYNNALEFRFRTGRAVTVETARHRVVTRVVLDRAVPREVVGDLLRKFCDYSLYAFEKQLAEGFITLRGGCRVGVAGTAVYTTNGGVSGVKDVSGLNLRVARECIGCAAPLYNTLRVAGMSGNVIIAGKPMTAKTTLLRDLCRLISATNKVVVIDTRGEIAASYGGVNTLDVGANTDVLTGFEKADGASRALRALSPEYVVCDEVDIADMPLAMFRSRGVRLIMTCHTEDISEGLPDLRGLPLLSHFTESGVTYVAAVSGLGNVGRVYKVE